MRKRRKIRLWYKYVNCIDNYAPAVVNKRGEIVAYAAFDPKTREKELIRIKHD
jgi:hypothetical protein